MTTMGSQRPDFEGRPVLQAEESQMSRLTKKAKSSPFIAAGAAGWVLAAMYGVYRYRTQGTKTSLPMYLIQLRVGAQGIVVGMCLAGLGYTMYKDWFKKPGEESTP